MMRRRPALIALVLAVLFSAPGLALGAQPPVLLGDAESFAVLAGSTITNTGPTTVTGDIGLHPGTAFPGQADVTVIDGAVYLTDAVALGAKDALQTAYDDAAGRTPVTRIATELGGMTLKPGVYDSASGTFQITGTLTLDAEGDPDGVFIFLTDSTLITASSSRVRTINSARFCRIFWKVGSSATLGTDSHFVGHIFAQESITANTRASVEGQLLALTSAVTLDTNVITNGLCASAQGAAINIAKSASPSALTGGPGSVTYTYTVTNPGTTDISDVSVTDDRLDTVTYVSGDTNSDELLQPGETWIYTATTNLTVTTTNTGTVTGTGNGVTLTDTAVATVTLTTPGTTPPGSTPVTTTVTGGVLPTTSTPWGNLMLAGMVFTFIGAVGWRRTAQKIDE